MKTETLTKRHGNVAADLIDRKVGKKMVIDNHYSHKDVNTSRYYIGCFINNELVGVATFGIAMNPHSCSSIVKDTKIDEYLELNRLWIKDDVGHNIETVFLGLCFKWIKVNLPKIKWIQSFADGRVGVGTIYQAANFTYCGFHMSKFWEDTETGEVYHNSVLTRKTRKKYYELMERIDKLKSFSVKTYRYIYFIQRKEIKNLLKPVLPYPKKGKYTAVTETLWTNY